MSTSRPARLRALVALAVALTSGAVLLGTQQGSAQAATAPDCGAPVVKGWFQNWKCTFSDDFNGSALDTSKWVAQTTAASGFGMGTPPLGRRPRRRLQKLINRVLPR